MTETVSVLVTAVGGIIGEGIMKSLKLANSKNGQRYEIVAVDASPQAAGLYRGDNGFVIPSASASDYIDSIIRICKEEQIRAILVGADEELSRLATASGRIAAESGAKVISNPPEVIATASDKWMTYRFLDEEGLPCAKSALLDEREEFIREFGFPLVVKPREGHGSEHFYLVRSTEEIEHAEFSIRRRGWDPMLQEYLPGDQSEFTTGITTDSEGRHVMSSIAMQRTLKNGQTYKAFIDEFRQVRDSAEEVALKLGTVGPINVQARIVDDEAKVFEINLASPHPVPFGPPPASMSRTLSFATFCSEKIHE